MEDSTLKELRDAVVALTEKVSTLEAKIARLEAQQAVPEEDLVAIGAALAAYFGYKPKIRAIRFGQQTHWAAASRGRVHDRSVPHVR
ncbi:MAG: hypothetical protein QM713_11630 [Arachnia sp.]